MVRRDAIVPFRSCNIRWRCLQGICLHYGAGRNGKPIKVPVALNLISEQKAYSNLDPQIQAPEGVMCQSQQSLYSNQNQ